VAKLNASRPPLISSRRIFKEKSLGKAGRVGVLILAVTNLVAAWGKTVTPH